MSEKVKSESHISGCDFEQKEVSSVRVHELRLVLQNFNEEIGRYINNDQHHKLGRVLTIIDASISDLEQRKAVKDLVRNGWWDTGRNYDNCRMDSPHTDLRGLCNALGFELYPEAAGSAPMISDSDYSGWATSRYQKIIKE